MKILILIRHAKSSWDEPGLSDFDRPLNTRGLKNADEMALHLKEKIGSIDTFISSPALRAKTTAGKFVAAYNTSTEKIKFEEGLYMAQESFFEQLISNLEDSLNTVAIFSHNPGITEFANTLTFALKTDNMPTCSIFAVKANTGSWKNFSSTVKELLFYDYPKLHG